MLPLKASSRFAEIGHAGCAAEELTGLAEGNGEGEDAWYEDDPEEISEQEAVELSLHVIASAAEISEDSAAAVGAAPPART